MERMVRQIKEERVIKLFLDKLYINAGIDSHMEYYLTDAIMDDCTLYNKIRIANINHKRKIIFLFIDIFPFYNKKAHKQVMNFFSNYIDYEIELFSVDNGITKVEDLV